MKTRFIILFLSIWTLSGCMNSDKFYETGVSHELAVARKENITGLEYSVGFKIPECRDSTIYGTVDIDFCLSDDKEVIIDFRELDNVKKVYVNGAPARYTLLNEHIIIPSGQVDKGNNRVSVEFAPDNQSFNRNDEFLYTLLVPDRARTIFPCFDQPDMKAVFKLTLELPESWTAVSNSPVEVERVEAGRRFVSFGPTEPLSTYLFSFVAGLFDNQTFDDGKHRFTAYHRETDPARISQLPTIFSQVASSLEWLEEYTGVKYPFAKYDFIILPGFQYGGMEHTGATLYNDTRMFLSENPTLDEELSRAELIAHETAHMWFGDFVTMKWFDDVWTKEVFANYFASRMTEPLFPDVNHSLKWLKNITAPALNEDRTAGGTAIRQPLDNMRNAGLVYNSIIYNKAPVMLRKLVEIMGEEKFREGIHDYLVSYAYNNASWNDLISILDDKCEEDLASFSNVWVNSNGMPHIDFNVESDALYVKQTDPYDRGLVWPQSFDVCLVGDDQTVVEVSLKEFLAEVSLDKKPTCILPNSDGRGYGYFRYDESSLQWVMKNWAKIDDVTCRQSQLMNLYEEYQHERIDADAFLKCLLTGLQVEDNALIASTVCGYIGRALIETKDRSLDADVLSLAETHPLKSCRQQLLRRLIAASSDSLVCRKLYDIWQEASHPLLNENDYMNLAYELSVRNPEMQQDIITRQLGRISNPDRRRQFEFISRATTPDTLKQEALFRQLLKAENRRIEPWALETLEYLCHPLREEQAVRYIKDALEALPYIQRTSDIFFPQDWSYSLLNERYSIHSYNAVKDFLENNEEFPQLLKNKVLRSAWNLQRRN